MRNLLSILNNHGIFWKLDIKMSRSREKLVGAELRQAQVKLDVEVEVKYVVILSGAHYLSGRVGGWVAGWAALEEWKFRLSPSQHS